MICVVRALVFCATTVTYDRRRVMLQVVFLTEAVLLCADIVAVQPWVGVAAGR